MTLICPDEGSLLTGTTWRAAVVTSGPETSFTCTKEGLVSVPASFPVTLVPEPAMTSTLIFGLLLLLTLRKLSS